MELTNFELINVYNTLESYKAKKLPQRISYAITKNIYIIDAEYKIYLDELNKILQQYTDYYIAGEDGKPVIGENGIPEVINEKKDVFWSDLLELLNVKIAINIHTIPCAAFDYDDSDRYDALTCDEILTLQSIICKNDNVREE